MAMSESQYQQEVVLPRKISDLDAIVEDFGRIKSPHLLNSWKGRENLQEQLNILDEAERTPAVVFLKKLGIAYRYVSGNPYFDYHKDGIIIYPAAVDPKLSCLELEITDENVIFTKEELFKRIGLNFKNFLHRWWFEDITPKTYTFRREKKDPDAGMLYYSPSKISEVIIKELDRNHYKIEHVFEKH